MTISQIAERVAAERKLNPKKVAKLLEAEANLIKKAYPTLQNITSEAILNQRYNASPAASTIASIPVIFLATEMTGEGYDKGTQEAAVNFLALTSAIEGGDAIYGDEDLEKQLAGLGFTEWRYNISPAELAKAASKTKGLRKARGDVEAEFQRLAKGEITVEEYSDYIEGIEYQLEQHIYDEDWWEEVSKEPYPESEIKVDEAAFAALFEG